MGEIKKIVTPDWIRSELAKKRILSKDLATALHTTPQRISRWLSGEIISPISKVAIYYYLKQAYAPEPDEIKEQLPVSVYYEKTDNSHAELVATFCSKEMYMLLLPELVKDAEFKKMTISESID